MYKILLAAIFVNEDFSVSREVSCHNTSHLLGSTEQQEMPAEPPWAARQLHHQHGAWTRTGVASAPAAASHTQNECLNQATLSCQRVNWSLGCTISSETPLPGQPLFLSSTGAGHLAGPYSPLLHVGWAPQPANILVPVWPHEDMTGLTRSSCIISRCLCF